MLKEKMLCNKVDHERWQAAQVWEKQHWLRDQKGLARYGKIIFGVCYPYLESLTNIAEMTGINGGRKSLMTTTFFQRGLTMR